MHLEEMFWLIEEIRKELVAKRAARVAFAGSESGMPWRRDGQNERPSDEKIEAVLAGGEVTTGK